MKIIVFLSLFFHHPFFFHTEKCADHQSVTMGEHDCMRELTDDGSKADIDGPYVFYKKDGVVVKSIEKRDSSLHLLKNSYKNKSDVPALTCRIPETGDEFSFKLRDSIPVQPDIYPEPAKMLVISDIEGNFQAFKMLLQGLKVIDDQYQWSFGAGHLVMVGDFFDRGVNVTETLWLIYKLEEEAEAVGGKIHFILGNHEILNLAGNTQYVRNKYIENTYIINEPYEKWYADNTELGRWLRTKNAVEKIGNNVFCHGGISPELVSSGITLHEVNTIARKYLGVKNEEIFDNKAKKVFNQKTGIFWYRGISKRVATEAEVTEALAWSGSKCLIVGHTLVEEIISLYDKRVYIIDLYHDENMRQGVMKSLWIEEGVFYCINNKGERSEINAPEMVAGKSK